MTKHVHLRFVACSGILAFLFGYLHVQRTHSNAASSANLTSTKASNSDDLQIGQPAPLFALYDLEGHRQKLLAKRSQPVALAFFCGCNRCHTAATRIATLQRRGELKPFISVVALNREEGRRFQIETGLQGEILSDSSDAVARAYQSEFCPRLWALGPEGTITYRSGILLEGTTLAVALKSMAVQLSKKRR